MLRVRYYDTLHHLETSLIVNTGKIEFIDENAEFSTQGHSYSIPMRHIISIESFDG